MEGTGGAKGPAGAQVLTDVGHGEGVAGQLQHVDAVTPCSTPGSDG